MVPVVTVSILASGSASLRSSGIYMYILLAGRHQYDDDWV